MATTNRAQRESMDQRLGIHPMFEGLVIPHETVEVNNGIEKRVRESLLLDPAEAAFAEYNRWDYNKKQESIADILSYIRETQDDPNRFSYPIFEAWNERLADKTIDDAAEEIWGKLVTGVKRRHEGMDKFLTKHAIGDAKYEPRFTQGGVWRANVVRRGDERKEPSREVRLLNAEIVNGRVDIARLDFREPSPIYRENLARERRHGDASGVLYVGGYHVFALLYHLKDLPREKKLEMGLPGNYDVFSPFDFSGREHLVTEAVGRRYLPIQTRLQRERNIYAVSNFLLDHQEIVSSIKSEIERNNIFVGVGKLFFHDAPHRGVLDDIDYFLTKEQGYNFNGFSVDFREFGPEFQTVSTVYSKPDMSRSVHVIYDGKFDVPPLFLFKIKRSEWDAEKQTRDKQWRTQDSPARNPFELFGQWYHNFDRHTQRMMVNMITTPDKYVLDQHKDMLPEYNRFQQTRLNI